MSAFQKSQPKLLQKKKRKKKRKCNINQHQGKNMHGYSDRAHLRKTIEQVMKEAVAWCLHNSQKINIMK